MDSDKILAMVEIYPQSAKIIDAHQRLPLHIATKRKANEIIIRTLYKYNENKHNVIRW